MATRPVKQTGLGMKVADAIANQQAFSRRTVFCDESENVAKSLAKLVTECNLRGTRIHDANVAATMQMHGISNLVTANTKDFNKLPGLALHTIKSLAQSV